MSTNYPMLAHQWFDEVWNQRRAKSIDRLLDTNAIMHGIVDENGNELRGVQAFKAFHARFLEAFPSLTVEVLDTVSQGDMLAVRCLVRGRHGGDSLGFAATQKDIEFTGIAVARVKDGKFIECWNNFDFLAMYSQMGVLKELEGLNRR